jgi:hypothetical protein
VIAFCKFKRPAMDTRYPDWIVNQNAVTIITRGVNRRGSGIFIKPPPAHKTWIIRA